MHLLVRAVVMGFGLAAGAALYKRVAGELGIDPDARKDKKNVDAEPAMPPMDPPAGALRSE
jgi:hypothetical protein